MQPAQPQDYKQLITEVIKKQIVILGPDITLAKARNVPGLTITDDGTVTALAGDPQGIIQKLIEQFVELSGLIVRKTMEPLLMTQGIAPITDATPAVPPVQPILQTPPPVVPEPQLSTTPTAGPATMSPMQQPTSAQPGPEAHQPLAEGTPPVSPELPPSPVVTTPQPIAETPPLTSQPTETNNGNTG